ncbi:TonB family protein [Marinicella sp. W31]|uniref:TonB family protein n=1 Tax=Marinicella sp. W31 TaxID=3023713 RepID=UPI003756C12C
MNELMQISNAIGWTLIHFSWQALLIVAAYWIVTRSVSKNQVTLKYWVGMSAVALCLIIPAYSLVNSLSQVSHQATSATLLSLPAIEPVVNVYQTSATDLIIYLINLSLPYLVVIWALLVFVLSFNLVKSWMDLQSILKHSENKKSDHLTRVVKEKAAALGLIFKPVLKLTDHIAIPATFGFFKPVILLPISIINKLPIEQVELIILHELCHIRRNDFLHNLLQLLTDTLFFFHPFIRWMNNDIRHVREQCCDQMVLNQNSEPLTYAHALTNVADMHLHKNSNAQLQIGLNDGQLMDRVRTVLMSSRKKQSSVLLIPALCALIVTYGVMLLGEGQDEIGDFILTERTVPVEQPENRLFFKPESFAVPHIEKPQAQSVNKSTASTTQVKAPAEKTTAKVKIAEKEILTASQPVIETNLVEQKEIIQPTGTGADIESTFQTAAIDTQSSMDTSSAASKFNDAMAQDILQPSEEITLKIADPILRKSEAPAYPSRYRRDQIESQVVAQYKINESGRVYDIEVKFEENYNAFGSAVIRAMKKWRYDPSSLTNAHLDKTYQRTFNFSLQGDTAEKNDAHCGGPTTGTRVRMKSGNCSIRNIQSYNRDELSMLLSKF